MATLPRRFPTLPFLEIPTTPLADVRLPWAGVRLPGPEIPETQIPDIPAIREVTPFAEVLAERIAESNKALAEQIVESIKSAPQEETLVKLETRGRRGKWDWEEAISAAWDKVMQNPKSRAILRASCANGSLTTMAARRRIARSESEHRGSGVE
jgi:hypothetical protein